MQHLEDMFCNLYMQKLYASKSASKVYHLLMTITYCGIQSLLDLLPCTDYNFVVILLTFEVRSYIYEYRGGSRDFAE